MLFSTQSESCSRATRNIFVVPQARGTRKGASYRPSSQKARDENQGQRSKLRSTNVERKSVGSRPEPTSATALGRVAAPAASRLRSLLRQHTASRASLIRPYGPASPACARWRRSLRRRQHLDHLAHRGNATRHNLGSGIAQWPHTVLQGQCLEPRQVQVLGDAFA
jgi:hypothetical protein